MDEESHKNCVELSGKLVLLFHIVKLAEQLGDKVYVSCVAVLSHFNPVISRPFFCRPVDGQILNMDGGNLSQTDMDNNG